MNDGVMWTLGWTLIHGLWVGALVIGLAFCSRSLRRPRARYGAAMLLLAVLALSLPVTYAVVESGRGMVLARNTASLDSRMRSAALPSERTVRPATETPGPPEPVTTDSAEGTASWLTPLRRALPWLWLSGTCAGLAWLATAACSVRRLRRRAHPIRTGRAQRVLRHVARDLDLRRHVEVAASESVVSPLVVGIRRPLVVLPLSHLSCWSDEELELVLLHELAHIKRHDNLANLAQRALECALFFQPAAWWISRWVRHERELCCDEIVVDRLGRQDLYARTLLSMASAPGSAHPLSLAMSRTPLVDRIAHILDKEHQPMKIPLGLSFPAAALALGAFLMIDVQAQDPPPRGTLVAPTLQAVDTFLPHDMRLPAALPTDVDMSAASCTACHVNAHRPAAPTLPAAHGTRAIAPLVVTRVEPPVEAWTTRPAPRSASCSACHHETPKTRSAGRTSMYVVQKGDTLTRISLDLLGTSTHVPLLRSVNPILATDPLLKVGQHLLIPTHERTGTHGATDEKAASLEARLMQLEQATRDLREEIASRQAQRPSKLRDPGSEF